MSASAGWGVGYGVAPAFSCLRFAPADEGGWGLQLDNIRTLFTNPPPEVRQTLEAVRAYLKAS